MSRRGGGGSLDGGSGSSSLVLAGPGRRIEWSTQGHPGPAPAPPPDGARGGGVATRPPRDTGHESFTVVDWNANGFAPRSPSRSSSAPWDGMPRRRALTQMMGWLPML